MYKIYAEMDESLHAYVVHSTLYLSNLIPQVDHQVWILGLMDCCRENEERGHKKQWGTAWHYRAPALSTSLVSNLNGGKNDIQSKVLRSNIVTALTLGP